MWLLALTAPETSVVEIDVVERWLRSIYEDVYRKQLDDPRLARMIDPLTMFVAGLGGIDDIEVLSDSQRNVAISHVGADGTIRPAGSRVVWPVACR